MIPEGMGPDHMSPDAIKNMVIGTARYQSDYYPFERCVDCGCPRTEFERDRQPFPLCYACDQAFRAQTQKEEHQSGLLDVWAEPTAPPGTTQES